MKRLFDIIGSIVGLLFLFPVLILAALLVKLDSRGPVFFRQERIGKNFKPFQIYKFRTMVQDAGRAGRPITVGEDPRITRVGRFLRKTKIDELPQLMNVLKGDMSLVGPRPEVPEYVKLFQSDYAEILNIRPGITDLASLKYRDEAAVLRDSDNPEQEYLTRILPDKLRLAKEYVQRSSLFFDLGLILQTLRKLFA
ncbi:MAG TPA: sugar transferase [Candidatus Binatia bacterium]|nr:sugar transferase [Candidatus Binatia bacterium]